MKHYRISSDNVSEIIEAQDRSEAEGIATEWIKDGDWGDGKFRVSVVLQEVDELQEDIGDHWAIEVEVGDDPEPPDCREDYDHEWVSPVEVVGGIKENPGVWSTGGTTFVTKDVCRHCGVYRKRTDYGSQRNPGQCDKVEYLDPDEASLAYVESEMSAGMRTGRCPANPETQRFLEDCDAVVTIVEDGDQFTFDYNPRIEVSHVPESLGIEW